MRVIKTKWWGVVLVSATLLGCSDDDASPPTPVVAPLASSEVTAEKEAVAESEYSVAASFNVGENTYVRSMFIDTKANSLWVGTSAGAMEVDLASADLRATYTREHGLANEYVFGIHVDQKGDRWFGTNGGGISKLTTDKQWKTYFPMHGLADYWVYSFAEQSDGTLWVGTWAGLNRLNSEKEVFHTYLEELVNEWVYGLDVDSKDRVWIGTEGGVNMFDGTSWFTWTHADGMGAANEQNLPLSTNTGLGTRSRHDLDVTGGGQLTYNPNYVFSLMVAADDTVWVGTWGGGAAHYDGKSWTNFSSKDGLAGNIVYSIAQDKEGGLWFGTNGGLSHFDGKTWHNFDQSDGLLDNNIYAIAPDPSGRIWVGSRAGVAMLVR